MEEFQCDDCDFKFDRRRNGFNCPSCGSGRIGLTSVNVARKTLYHARITIAGLGHVSGPVSLGDIYKFQSSICTSSEPVNGFAFNDGKQVHFKSTEYRGLVYEPLEQYSKSLKTPNDFASRGPNGEV
jgi:hypothetical protein